MHPKLTPAQLRYLREHLEDGKPQYKHIIGLYPDGFRPKVLVDRKTPTYDFVGRLRDLGVLTIIDGEGSGWPYSWDGTQITDTGRVLLAARVKG